MVNVIQACINESRRLSAESSITLSPTFAYRYPTPRAMIEALAPNVTKKSSVGDSTSRKSQEQIMEDYVTTLTRGLGSDVKASTAMQTPGTETVLVTGTTGALGAHFLADLLSRPSVQRVFAFNRGIQTELFDRQQQALVNNGQNIDLKQEVDRGRVVLVAGDLAKEDWGIDAKIFNEVRTPFSCGHAIVNHLIYS